MKDHKYEKYICVGVTAVIVILIAVLAVFAFLERKSLFAFGDKIFKILSPVVLGAVLAFLVAPIYNFVNRWVYKTAATSTKRERMAHWIGKMLATAASLVFIIIVIASLCIMIIPQLYSSVVGIINNMSVYVQNIYNWLTEIFVNNPELEATVLSVYQKVVDYVLKWTADNLISNMKDLQNLQNIEKILGGVSSGVLGGVMGVINLVKNLFIGLIVMVYLLNIKDTLAAQGKKIVYAFLPLKAANETVEEVRYIHRVFSGFIIGKLIDSLIIGIICYVLMVLFKLPFELLISVIVGVTNIIPFFGPFIGAIPSAVLVFLISPKQCLYFIGLILLLQQFDGNILGPKILGNSTGLSSFWVLFSILLFGGLFGFAGMILAVPVTAVIFDLFSKLQYRKLRKKNLSPDTRDYRELKRIDEENGKYLS